MKTHLNTIAIDDQQSSLTLIDHFTKANDKIKLINTFTNVFEAAGFIKQNQVDLLILDLNMAPVDGISFLRLLSKSIPTIIMTGYEQFLAQIDNFELNPIDVLMKPFSREKFSIAARRAYNQICNQQLQLDQTIPESTNYIFLKNDTQFIKVDYEDILFIESYSHRIKVHTNNQIIQPTIRESLNSIEEKQLLPINGPTDKFQRVHRSFIINIQKIEAVNGNCSSVTINQNTIPISPKYRNNLAQRIGLYLQH
jgi:DNA-binding LytR/AlgR family response regulator